MGTNFPGVEYIIGQLNDDMYAAHVTIAELARRTGIHVNVLGRMLRGERDMKLSRFEQILDALELDLSDFVSRAKAREQEIPRIES